MSSKVQTSGPQPSDISSWGEDPLFHVTRLCLVFLQHIFKSAPRESGLQWDEDEELSQIIVQDEAPINAELVNKRPAIVSVLSGVQFAGVALDQIRDLNLKTGARVHTDMVSGNITLNCLSRVKVRARKIGWLVGRHFWILRRELLLAGLHDIGQRINIGAVSPPGAVINGDPGEIRMVPVVVPFHFQWTESVTPTNLQIMEGVRLSLGGTGYRPILPDDHDAPRGESDAAFDNVTGASAGTSSLVAGTIRPPHMRGRPIVTEADRPGSEPGPVIVTVEI